MDLKVKILVKEQLPVKSDWYDTNEGNIFWFANDKVWSCRDDRVSEEYPKWWLAEPLDVAETQALSLQSVTHRALLMKIKKLEADNELLNFMVENGLGEEDMMNDITYPHEL